VSGRYLSFNTVVVLFTVQRQYYDDETR